MALTNSRESTINNRTIALTKRKNRILKRNLLKTIMDQMKEKSIARVRVIARVKVSKIRAAMSTEEMIRNFSHEIKTKKVKLTNVI